ncbi:hypothetical protein [Gillisia sp. CAL575]|uniref:hypothetical protein n=1 Tax=Gillisia sp. CAL575 TaxID=985255 RepID=UPI00054F6CA2|nr:hypothetical protein [Gillisia sp. CAL575]
MENHISKFIVSLGCLILLQSCNYFQTAEEREVVARVNENYLYVDEIQSLVGEGVSGEDSTLMVNDFIKRWATQQLLIDKAKFNLSTAQQKEFDELVSNYKNELYSKAYADAMVAKRLDTTFNQNEIEEYYNEHLENFRLNEDLVKLRFINLPNNLDFDDVKRKFIRFNEADKSDLDKISLQFKSYSFNDSVWVGTKSVYNRIIPLNDGNKSQLLKKSNFLQLEDSLEVYLVYVNDVLLRNDQAPLEYAVSTIKQILLNKRKANLVKELEKDITRDAIENKQFEIYN